MGSCRSLVDLLPVAVEVVRIAFRIGVIVAEARDEIGQIPNKSPSWSGVVPGLKDQKAAEILKSFHDSRVRAPKSKPSGVDLILAARTAMQSSLYQRN